MTICATCNGWGIVYSIRTPPPSTAEKRMATRAKRKVDKLPDHLMVMEISCGSCGGFGTRPDHR